jgi:hypothetical protein
MPPPKIKKANRSREHTRQKTLFDAKMKAAKEAKDTYQEWRRSDRECEAQQEATTELVAKLLEMKVDFRSADLVSTALNGFVLQWCSRPRVPKSIFHPGEPGWEIDDIRYF